MYSSEFYERVFVQMVVEKAREKGLNHSQTARLIWGDDPAVVVKWRKIRNESAPQSLTVSDSAKIAQALGMSTASLHFEVEEKVKLLSKGQEAEQPPNERKRDAAG